MSKNKKFNKPPLTTDEKEKKAEEFLNFFALKNVNKIDENNVEVRKFKKEDTKAFPLRLPKSLAEDITEIHALTGLSMNAVCVELMRPAAKQKLKELKE